MYEFVGVEGKVLPECLSVIASMFPKSGSDHKNPLIDFFKKEILSMAFN